MSSGARPPLATRTPRAWWLTAIAAVLGLAVGARTQDPVRTQDGDAAMRPAVLRVMFVLKLAPYLGVELEGAGKKKEEYRIAVVGTDSVTEVAPVHLLGKKVGDLPVKLVTLTLEQALTARAADSYDLLYVAGTLDRDSVRQIVTAHADKPKPLVCDQPGFAALGGGVQLFVLDNCIRFEVNAEALKKQGVRTNSQLLKLSRKGPTR